MNKNQFCPFAAECTFCVTLKGYRCSFSRLTTTGGTYWLIFFLTSPVAFDDIFFFFILCNNTLKKMSGNYEKLFISFYILFYIYGNSGFIKNLWYDVLTEFKIYFFIYNSKNYCVTQCIDSIFKVSFTIKRSKKILWSIFIFIFIYYAIN